MVITIVLVRRSAQEFCHFAIGKAVVARELSGSKEVFKLLKYTAKKL